MSAGCVNRQLFANIITSDGFRLSLTLLKIKRFKAIYLCKQFILVVTLIALSGIVECSLI